MNPYHILLGNHGESTEILLEKRKFGNRVSRTMWEGGHVAILSGTNSNEEKQLPGCRRKHQQSIWTGWDLTVKERTHSDCSDFNGGVNECSL